MDRRKFIQQGGVATLSVLIHAAIPYRAVSQSIPDVKSLKRSHRLPTTDGHYQGTCGYIEDEPVPNYSWASEQAYENFQDLKFGIRIHWGVYSLLHMQEESWPFLKMMPPERHMYQELYKSWNPTGFNADEWMDIFSQAGAQMFSFTSKHHDGFSMYDTKTRVRRRANWIAEGGPQIEECDLAYSIMETPFKRDVVKELCEAAAKKKIKVDIYYSHPDWYDANFRPYTFHPLQVPHADKMAVRGKEMRPELEDPTYRFGKSGFTVVTQPSTEEVQMMMERHRAQLMELITQYGEIDMVCLDMFLGPQVWPQLRETMLQLRQRRPDIMYRARGIGNYGDYYTPEGFVPGSKENTDVPWFVIYPLGGSFSYEPVSAKYKGARWIVENLVDSISKGGNFMVGIGPDGNGKFHTEAISQLLEAGKWIKWNAEGIYGTRARNGELWKEGEHIRYTRSKSNTTVYAFSMKWPGNQLVLKNVMPRKGTKIYLLGSKLPLRWTYAKDGQVQIPLSMELKNTLPSFSAYGYVFKIHI